MRRRERGPDAEHQWTPSPQGNRSTWAERGDKCTARCRAAVPSTRTQTQFGPTGVHCVKEGRPEHSSQPSWARFKLSRLRQTESAKLRGDAQMVVVDPKRGRGAVEVRHLHLQVHESGLRNGSGVRDHTRAAEGMTLVRSN